MKTLAAGLLLLSLPCRAADNAWSRLLTFPERPPSIRAVGIVSDHRLGRVYVITETGDFYRTGDGGTTWAIIKPTIEGGTTAVAIDPVDSNTVYRVTAKRLLKSTNGGVNWWRIDSAFADSVSALAVAPNARESIYVAVTEHCETGTCQPGAMMESRDGGMSWHHDGLEGVDARAIIVDHANTAYVIAHSYVTRNVFKSVGAGFWTPLFPDIAVIFSWVVDPFDSQIIYTTAQFRYEFAGRQYRSTDGGRSWTEVRFAIQGNPESFVWLRLADPHRQGVFYGIAHPHVARSTDGGITWQYLRTGLPEGSSITTLTLDGDTLLAGVVGTTPGTSGVYEYTSTFPPPARRRAARR